MDPLCRGNDEVWLDAYVLEPWQPASMSRNASTHRAAVHTNAGSIEVLGEDARALLLTDIAKREHGLGSPEWTQALADALGAQGVTGVSIDGEGHTPLDRLTARQPASTVDGPLISVIMSAYRPTAEIFSAVKR